MIVEVSLQYAGAAALLANVHRVHIQEICICAWSIQIMLDDGLVEHRAFAKECKQQGLLYKEDI